jgi:photosystem II stability/assembly factor-like uncharacterized protein
MKKTFLLFTIVLLTVSINAQWVEQTSGVTVTLDAVSAVNNNVAWACGGAGTVLRTINGGATWENKTGANINGDLYNIFAWDSLNALTTSSPSTGTYVYRTTNGGTTWDSVFFQAGGFMDVIWMFSATNGIMIGDPVGGRWTIFKTSNGGATWDSTGMFLAQNGTEAGWNNSIYVSGNNVYFGTSNSRVYYSSNMGASWTAQPMTLTNSFGIWFNSPTRGIVGGSTQGLVSTTNGGTNWNAMTSLATGTIYSVIGYSNIWYYTRGTRIFGSTDDGATWDTVYTAASTIQCLTKARNGDVAWAVRSSGGITKGTNIGLPVELTSFTASVSNGQVLLNWVTATEINNRVFEVERKSANGQYNTIGYVDGHGTTTEEQSYSYVDRVEPGIYTYRLKQIDYDGRFEYSDGIEVEVVALLEYSLDQNYPNPFNPTTNIKYSVANAGNVKLLIYNILGQQIKELVNGYKEAGKYEINFNASELPSGAYFYKLETAGFNETKKMLLTK